MPPCSIGDDAILKENKAGEGMENGKEVWCQLEWHLCKDFEVGREEAVQKDFRQREQRAWREGAGNREEEQMALGARGSGLVAGSGQFGVQGKG